MGWYDGGGAGRCAVGRGSARAGRKAGAAVARNLVEKIIWGEGSSVSAERLREIIWRSVVEGGLGASWDWRCVCCIVCQIFVDQMRMRCVLAFERCYWPIISGCNPLGLQSVRFLKLSGHNQTLVSSNRNSHLDCKTCAKEARSRYGECASTTGAFEERLFRRLYRLHALIAILDEIFTSMQEQINLGECLLTGI